MVLGAGASGGLSSYDDLPDGLVVADEVCTVVVFNSAAARITGVDADFAVGKRLEDVLPLEGLDGRAWWPCVRPYDGLRTVNGHPERNLLLPGGPEILVTARYVRDEPRGPVRRVVVGLRDTRHRAREELSRAELVSTVAHELRSPLTSVKGFTATLLAKWDRFTDEQKRLMLETVNADADRVTRLITELLDISRIDSGRLTIRRQVVDIGRVAHRHVAGMVAGGHAEARFEVSVVEGIPEMWVDADKLDQVVANLLENAVHHGDGTVRIVVEPDGDGAAVTVTDEGEGIAQHLQDRVFTRFWRSGRRGGTGLGLYIVRGLVEAHGGRIEVGNAPGGGARFRFVLPAATPDFAD
ncbi:MAG: PAS domain-containing protein [Pseudonocardia sp.]|nr:PAS domain-containing protein [Pseudonocardia sp.]